MKQWRIKVIGKQRKIIDKPLIVQAVLAIGRHLKALKALRDKKPGSQKDTA